MRHIHHKDSSPCSICSKIKKAHAKSLNRIYHRNFSISQFVKERWKKRGSWRLFATFSMHIHHKDVSPNYSISQQRSKTPNSLNHIYYKKFSSDSKIKKKHTKSYLSQKIFTLFNFAIDQRKLMKEKRKT